MTENTDLLVLGTVAVTFGVIVVLGFVQTPADSLAALTRAYIQLSRLPPRQAKAQLADRVDRLAQRFPGQTHEWYVEWLVTDLRRAKR